MECIGLLRQAVNKDVWLLSHGAAPRANGNTHQTHSADCSVLIGMPWIDCVEYASRMWRMCGMYSDRVHRYKSLQWREIIFELVMIVFIEMLMDGLP